MLPLNAMLRCLGDVGIRMIIIRAKRALLLAIEQSSHPSGDNKLQWKRSPLLNPEALQTEETNGTDGSLTAR